MGDEGGMATDYEEYVNRLLRIEEILYTVFENRCEEFERDYFVPRFIGYIRAYAIPVEYQRDSWD